MKVKSESEVAQSCPTLSDPMDCSRPGSSILGIFQARVLEWVAIAFSDMEYYSAIKGRKFATMWMNLNGNMLHTNIQLMEFSRPEYWSG